MSKRMNNITPKIFALIIAVILWSYVMSEVNPEISTEYRNIEVKLNNLPTLERQGLVVMEPKESTINVRVAGKKSDMKNFSSRYITAYADLSGYSEGQHRVPVRVSLSDNSSNVRVTNIEPNEVLFTFDKVITREKAVSIKTKGNVDSNHIVEDISVNPQTVFITGPRTWVNEVAEARVSVNLEDRTSSTTLNLPVKLLDDQEEEVRDIGKDPSKVDVDISILKQKTVPIRLQTRGELPDNYDIDNIRVYPSTIALKGGDKLDDLKEINTKSVDLNSLLDSSSTEVELDLPENVQLVNPDQKVTISYTVEETGEKSYEFDFEDIDLRNLEEGLSLAEEDSKISIKLKGDRHLLDDLTKEDIKLYVDLKDLGEGSHDVDINMEGISGISIDSIDPRRLKLELIKEDE